MNIRLLLIYFWVFHNVFVQSALEKTNIPEKYSVQKGVEKIETGLQIGDSLSIAPHEMLSFSKKLLQDAEKEVPNSMLLARVLRVVADAFYYTDSLEKSNQYLIQAITIAEEIKLPDTLFVGGAYSDLGLNYQEIGSFTEARNCLLKAIGILEGSSQLESLADAKCNLAALYHASGNYEQAINLFHEVYEIDVKTGNKNSQSSSLNNIGRLYIDWGKYETGLEYYFRSMELFDTLADRQMLAVRYNNIGMAYQLMKKHEEAISWIEKAKQIEEEQGDFNKAAIRYSNLASSYSSLKNYDKAKYYFEKADSIYSRSSLYSTRSKINAGLGQLYFVQNINDKALWYFTRSEEYAEKAGTLPEKSNIALHFYQFYKVTGNYRKALEYKEEYTELKDSIYNLSVARQMEEMQVKYQTAQKEAEIIRLESENELKQKEVLFRKRERNWALVGAILLLVFSVSIFLLFAKVRKQKTELAKQNDELEKLNKTLNHLFGIISHDLRNATAAYQSSAKVIEHHLKNGQPEKLLPLTSEINKNARQLSSMLENLLNWSLIQTKGISPAKELINVKEAMERAVELFSENAKSKNNRIIIEAGDEQVWCDPESFQLILRNLLSNAIKFTSNGTIILKTSEAGENTEVLVSDTGVGMDASVLENIKNSVMPEARRGTVGEKGTGLGLSMVLEHITKNNGDFNIESKPQNGTSISIKLPANPK